MILLSFIVFGRAHWEGQETEQNLILYACWQLEKWKFPNIQMVFVILKGFSFKWDYYVACVSVQVKNTP